MVYFLFLIRNYQKIYFDNGKTVFGKDILDTLENVKSKWIKIFNRLSNGLLSYFIQSENKADVIRLIEASVNANAQENDNNASNEFNANYWSKENRREFQLFFPGYDRIVQFLIDKNYLSQTNSANTPPHRTADFGVVEVITDANNMNEKALTPLYIAALKAGIRTKLRSKFESFKFKIKQSIAESHIC